MSVIDYGNGIEEKYIPHLFERFYRIKNKSYYPTSGFGIGIYLVAEIIKMHQGTVDVISKVGEESTFSSTLPLLNENNSFG